MDFANTIHDSRAEDKGAEPRSISDVLQWAKEAALLSTAECDRLVAGYAHNASPLVRHEHVHQGWGPHPSRLRCQRQRRPVDHCDS